MGAIITLALVWIAMVIVVYLHELGHGGKSIRVKFGILPEGASMQARWKLGGLIVNLAIIVAVSYYKPEMILLQYVGLVSWMHFILYTILGSFNKEISRKKLIILNYKYPKAMRRFFKFYVFDDVPNELWWAFVPAGIITFIYFRAYYLPILGSIFTSILGAGL